MDTCRHRQPLETADGERAVILRVPHVLEPGAEDCCDYGLPSSARRGNTHTHTHTHLLTHTRYGLSERKYTCTRTRTHTHARTHARARAHTHTHILVWWRSCNISARLILVSAWQKFSKVLCIVALCVWQDTDFANTKNPRQASLLRLLTDPHLVYLILRHKLRLKHV